MCADGGLQGWASVRAAMPVSPQLAAPASPAQALPAPVALATGWQQLTDTRGRVYYYNHTTQITTWERPAASILPRNHIAQAPPPAAASEGQSHTSEGPGALKTRSGKVLAHWSRSSSDGRPYYLNHVTRQTTWDLPVAALLPVRVLVVGTGLVVTCADGWSCVLALV